MTKLFKTGTGVHEVEVGSEAHRRLLEQGAQPVNEKGETVVEGSAYDDLKVDELREIAASRDLEIPASAKKADLVDALEQNDKEPK